MWDNKSPGRGNQAAAGENKQMTTALTIAKSSNVTRAKHCASIHATTSPAIAS